MYDFIFVGGGVSARVLMLELLDKFPNARYLIIDKQVFKDSDALLTFWSNSSHKLDPIVKFRWNNISILGKTERLNNSEFQGIYLRDIYNYSDQIFRRYKNIEFRTESVSCVNESAHHVEVFTENKIYLTNTAFDSRYLEDDIDTLYMHDFVCEVHTRHLLPKSKSLDFLDNLGMIEGWVSFIYVVPTSEFLNQTHLVIVSKNKAISLDGEDQIKHYYSAGALNTQPIITKFSCSTIPLHINFNTSTTRVIQIGGRAGWIKPTTGYGLRNILINSKRISSRILNQSQSSYDRKVLYRYCDELMFYIMQRNPILVTDLLKRMFSSGDFESVMMFLNEESNIKNLLKVIFRLPIHVMIVQWLRFCMRRD